MIINNDHQAELKRGVKSFQDEQFRELVVKALKPVDRTFISIDQDGSVCVSLESLIREAKASGKYDKIIFQIFQRLNFSDESECQLSMDSVPKRIIRVISSKKYKAKKTKKTSKKNYQSSRKISPNDAISKSGIDPGEYIMSSRISHSIK